VIDLCSDDKRGDGDNHPWYGIDFAIIYELKVKLHLGIVIRFTRNNFPVYQGKKRHYGIERRRKVFHIFWLQTSTRERHFVLRLFQNTIKLPIQSMMRLEILFAKTDGGTAISLSSSLSNTGSSSSSVRARRVQGLSENKGFV
jgi:hypothetical protein